MFSKFFIIILALVVLHTHPVAHAASKPQPPVDILSQKEYSLLDRYGNSYVNDVFANNILLTLAYMSGKAKDGKKVDWTTVTAPFTYTLVLQPGQTFAFHDQVLPQYKGEIAKTTNAHFDSTEGFLSDGWLVGDGVCQLASFMNVVARSAGLGVVDPTPHNFARIPDVPKAFGVAIYYAPGEVGTSSLQNLYVTNTFQKPIAFVFTHQNQTLNIQVEKMD